MYSALSDFNAKNRQRGAALMIMMIILVVGVSAILVSSLNKPGLNTERTKITSDALGQAKQALIAYAVSNNTRPGNLPCPDTDAPGTFGYGVAQGSCSAGAIGRLPWKTLGITELVDDASEPLWYALSGNFRTVSATINSDTLGTLLVYGNDGTTLLTTPGSEAVAVVFAPGVSVGSQQRNST